MIRRAFIAAVALVVLVAGAAGGAWLWLEARISADGPHDRAVTLVIPKGAGLSVIARRLEVEGIVTDRWLVVAAARLRDVARDLKAGEYAVPARASIEDVLALLVSGKTIVHSITIPEGLTTADILRLVRLEDRLSGEITLTPGEGQMRPETWDFRRGDSRDDLIARMMAAQDALLADVWQARAEGLPLETPRDALILASIIEKETGVGEEREKVAGVFINRLRIGMRLQSDPTVIYAMTRGKRALGRALTRADWRFEDPYNTYTNPGLPPGPIASPGEAALRAAVNPAAHDYLYFVADGTGGHAFARTLREHNRNVARWRRIRDAQ